MPWYEDIVLGALGSGVNHPTLVFLNVVMALAVASLLLLLAVSTVSHPPLLPHVVVLLLLAIGLWASINWFISNVGLVDAQVQQQELFGTAAVPGAEAETLLQAQAAEDSPAKSSPSKPKKQTKKQK